MKRRKEETIPNKLETGHDNEGEGADDVISYLSDGTRDYWRWQRGVYAASQSSAVWTAAKHNPHLPVHPVLKQNGIVTEERKRWHDGKIDGKVDGTVLYFSSSSYKTKENTHEEIDGVA